MDPTNWDEIQRKRLERDAALSGRFGIDQVIAEATQDLRYKRCSIFEMPPVEIGGSDIDFERAHPDHPEAASNRSVRIDAAEFIYRIAKNQNGWGIDEVEEVWEFFKTTTAQGRQFIGDNTLRDMHEALFDRDAAVRSEITGALAHLAKTESIPFLQKLELHEDEDASIRRSLVKAIECCRKQKGTEIRYNLTALYSRLPGILDTTTIHLLYGTWESLIKLLAKDPRLLYDLPPRKFEELVAELLCREGLHTCLTPSSNDRGRDILAFHETRLGKHLYLVECKRYRSDRPVGVTVVRQLYGVVTQERATAGLVITTSNFTKNAVAFRNTVEHQMSLKDYESLCDWLSKYK